MITAFLYTRHNVIYTPASFIPCLQDRLKNQVSQPSATSADPSLRGDCPRSLYVGKVVRGWAHPPAITHHTLLNLVLFICFKLSIWRRSMSQEALYALFFVQSLKPNSVHINQFFVQCWRLISGINGISVNSSKKRGVFSQKILVEEPYCMYFSSSLLIMKGIADRPTKMIHRINCFILYFIQALVCVMNSVWS